MSGADLPVAEGFSAKGLWCVAYRAPHDALDVLVYRCTPRDGEVDLGDCVFAGRLRDDAWLSVIGAPKAEVLRDVAGWAKRIRSRA